MNRPPMLMVCMLFCLQNLVALSLSDYPEFLQKKDNEEFWQSPSKTSLVKVTYTKSLSQAEKDIEHHQRVYNAVLNHPITFFKTVATVVVPKEFAITQTHSIFEMERLYGMNGAATPQRLHLGTERNNWKSRKNFHDMRLFVNNLTSIKATGSGATENIQVICYDLGYLIALMHLAAKVDGLGTKVYLAKASKLSTKSYKIALSSFERSQDITDYFTQQDDYNLIRCIAGAMVKTQDYPTPNTSGYTYFKNVIYGVHMTLISSMPQRCIQALQANCLRFTNQLLVTTSHEEL